MSSRRKAALVAALAAAALAAQSCTSLPANTDPEVLRAYDPQPSEAQNLEPVAGEDPDVTLRGFYQAAAIPTQDYQAARGFLGDRAAVDWDPHESTLVIDRINITTSTTRGSNARAFEVAGEVVGSLDANGSYTAHTGSYRAEVELEKNADDEWLLTDVPNGTLLERGQLLEHYRPRDVFFYRSGGDRLVGDRRWLYSQLRAEPSALINRVLRGPSEPLAPAVETRAREDLTYTGFQDGTFHFDGAGGMSQEELSGLAAQLAWTLQRAQVSGPYFFEFDGSVLGGEDGVSADDFTDVSPEREAESPPEFFALNENGVSRVSANTTQPVGGELGQGGRVSSAEIADNGTAMAVRSRADGDSELVVGAVDGPVAPVLQASTIARPTLEPDGESGWVVVDGERIVRASRGAGGAVETADVEAEELEDLDGSVSVLRLSPDGARAALIVDGRVYRAAVARPSPGERRLEQLSEIAGRLEGTAVSLEWLPDGDLVVGASNAQSPIWQLGHDGAELSPLPSENVSAPVVGVAATSSTLYLTDSLAIRQRSAGMTEERRYWREVPGLQGVRSLPIVARATE
ncbi:LpqB family beta-propeller domain-containing protein [Corynebacterium otitidis]|uniref:LpqB family beta-propeller domain-containing protein n=1 Tax=Corynebacterium otitidis TaxID=29321 RepID=UPI000627C1F1|nr:LpqB family beta-propeller domain-containing protein [Corynebacterium otitidis]KKO84344.1 hypothetical protein AAV33_01475 [Corynebacterium otitidis]